MTEELLKIEYSYITIRYYYFTPLLFKEVATLTTTSASGGMTYCSVSFGRSKDMILQAGILDQAPIIHQVMSGVTLMREIRLFHKECQCFLVPEYQKFFSGLPSVKVTLSIF